MPTTQTCFSLLPCLPFPELFLLVVALSSELRISDRSKFLSVFISEFKFCYKLKTCDSSCSIQINNFFTICMQIAFNKEIKMTRITKGVWSIQKMHWIRFFIEVFRWINSNQFIIFANKLLNANLSLHRIRCGGNL